MARDDASAKSGKSKSWSLFKKKKSHSTGQLDDGSSVGDDGSTSSRGSILRLPGSKKKNKSKSKSSQRKSANYSDDYSTADSTASSNAQRLSLHQHLAKNDGYVDTASVDEQSMVSGLSSVGGTPSGSAYGSSDWAGVYGSNGNANAQSHVYNGRKKENHNRILEETGDDDDDDIMAIPLLNDDNCTPPVHHTPGMTAEDKFMAYFQKKLPDQNSASHHTSQTSPSSDSAKPASLSSLLSGANSSQPHVSPQAVKPSGDHVQTEKLNRQQQAELNAKRLREKQRQRQLQVLEQRRQREMEEQQQQQQKSSAFAQEQHPGSFAGPAPVSVAATPPPATVDTAPTSETSKEPEEITEVFLSPEEARKARARKAVEERKAKARAAVEARKAKVRAEMNGGVDPLAVEPAVEATAQVVPDGKEPLKKSYSMLSLGDGSNGSRSRKSGKSGRSSRSGKTSRSDKKKKKKRRSRSTDSVGGSSVGSADSALSIEQQDEFDKPDSEMKTAEQIAAEEQRRLLEQENERKRAAETERKLKLEMEIEKADKARIEAARLEQQKKEAGIVAAAAVASAEREAQQQKDIGELQTEIDESKAAADRKLEAEQARAEMLLLQEQLSSAGEAPYEAEDEAEDEPEFVIPPGVLGGDPPSPTESEDEEEDTEPMDVNNMKSLLYRSSSSGVYIPSHIASGTAAEETSEKENPNEIVADEEVEPESEVEPDKEAELESEVEPDNEVEPESEVLVISEESKKPSESEANVEEPEVHDDLDLAVDASASANHIEIGDIPDSPSKGRDFDDDLDNLLDDDLSALLDDSDAFESALNDDVQAIANSPTKTPQHKSPVKQKAVPIKSPTLSPVKSIMIGQKSENTRVTSPLTVSPKSSRSVASVLPQSRQSKMTPSATTFSAKKKLFNAGESTQKKIPAPIQTKKTSIRTLPSYTTPSSNSSIESGSFRSNHSRPHVMRMPVTRSTPRRRRLKKIPPSPARSVASVASADLELLPRSPHRPLSDDESEGPTCDHPFIAKLHRTRGHCQVCVFHLSKSEREMFEKNGRHLRVNIAYGGCQDCEVFPKENEDDEPVRLCCKCFFDTHKMGRHTYRPFSGGLVFAGASPIGHR